MRNRKTAERERAKTKVRGKFLERERDTHHPLSSMETGEQVLPSATATAPTAGDPTASSPPLVDPFTVPDPDIDLDDVAEPEIHVLISDEEHDHDHEHDHENEHDHDEGQERDHVADTVVSFDDLKLKIIKQVNLLLQQ